MELIPDAQARHQPSLSAFYAYVEHDGSPSGSNNGSQVDIGVVPGSWASCSDYQAEDIWVGQGKTRSSSSLEEVIVSEPLARLGTQPLEQSFLRRCHAKCVRRHD